MALSWDSAAVDRVSAAPAITNGTRGPPRATIRPEIGDARAIMQGIGSSVRPARSALKPAHVLQVERGQEEEPGAGGDRADGGRRWRR